MAIIILGTKSHAAKDIALAGKIAKLLNAILLAFYYFLIKF
jgi:hypothetical protein